MMLPPAERVRPILAAAAAYEPICASRLGTPSARRSEVDDAVRDNIAKFERALPDRSLALGD
jgi:hypothetical protein